ncbi:MAG: PhnD/SsuA/transferrin family substrate-binding protein [Anaerolineae bacterium]
MTEGVRPYPTSVTFWQHCLSIIILGIGRVVKDTDWTRQVDAAAIDSTVLELVCAQHPEVRAQLRIIATFGPSPMPPWVIGRHIAPELGERVRTLLLHMHENPHRQAILPLGQIACLAEVTDQAYDAIRHMLEVGAGVTLGVSPSD